MSKTTTLVEATDTPPSAVYYRVGSKDTNSFLCISQISGTGNVTVQFTTTQSTMPDVVPEAEWQELLVNSTQQEVSADHPVLSLPVPILYRFSIPGTVTNLKLAIQSD